MPEKPSRTETRQARVSPYRGQARPTDTTAVRKKCCKFEEQEGRRPRILVAGIGRDEREHRTRIMATAFSDLGFDVDVGPLFHSPAEIATLAVENDVHVIIFSSPASEHNALLPALIQELGKQERDDILVAICGDIPEQDYAFLYRNGAALIISQGTEISVIVKKTLEILMEQRDYV